MRENIPVRRSRPLPGVYPAISADGFVPVHGDFDDNDGNVSHFHDHGRERRHDHSSDCGREAQQFCSCDDCNPRNARSGCGNCQTASACSSNCDCGWQARPLCSCDDCDTRNARSDCGTCQTASPCGSNCDCGCEAQQFCACDDSDTCNTCRTPGMVYNADHSLCRRMNAADGIRHGTLFRELLKPFAACPNPTGCAEISDCQALAFAAWELRLYLNTHPDDCEALRLFEEYESKLRQENYATTFVPGRKGRSRWNWLDDPWPWETCANRGRS